MSDVCLKYLTRSNFSDGSPIPVLDERKNTIAGVRVGDLHASIPPENREAIRLAIGKLTMRVEYVKNFSPKDLQNRRNRGWSETKIEKHRREVRTNVTMKEDSTSEDAQIKWTASKESPSPLFHLESKTNINFYIHSFRAPR